MSKATVHLAYVAAGLTCQGAVDILRKIGSGQEDKTLLESLLKPMLTGMAFTDGLTFLRDVVKSTKATKEGKPDPVVEQQVSRVRQIFAAHKMVPGFKIDGLGYWAAVEAARKALSNKGIRASGATILTEQQKADKAKAEAAKPLEAEVLAKIKANPQMGEHEIGRLFADADKRAADIASNDTVQKHADRIIKANGVDYAAKLIDALTTAIGAAETERSETLAADIGKQVQEQVQEPAPKKARQRKAA